MQWKLIPEYPNYEVSDEGQIRNIRTGRFLKPSVNSTGIGMPVVSLVNNNKTTVFEVRFIVAAAFLGVDINANPKPKIEYINDDKFDNAVTNIRVKQIEEIDGEEWRPIRGFETSYAVSNKGRVKRLSRIDKYIRKDTGKECERKVSEMIIKLRTDDEYYEVNLREGDKNCWQRVHRAVAEAFIPNPYNLPQINHIDGNKHNNNVENLEWCTCQDNIQHSVRTGLRSSNKGVSRFPRQLKCIETNEIFSTIREAAKKLELSEHYLRDKLKTDKTCHGLHFEFVGRETMQVKCLDTGQTFDTISAACEHFNVESITDAIRRRTCIDGWTFCYVSDNVDEEAYLAECRNRYSKWPRANKRWENES